MKDFCGFGFYPADILVPGKGTQLGKWSVIACDQYTSEPDYWQRVQNAVAGCPSALDIILPEAFLDEGNLDTQVDKINSNMRRLLYEDFFDLYRNCFVYVERTLRNGHIRRGLVGAVDLEAYDYDTHSLSLVRATEGTVEDRLPCRVRIRRNAPLEMPHIMLLADDPEKRLIEPLSDIKERLFKLYDFDLMENSGHVRGWLVSGDNLSRVSNALSSLADAGRQNARYGDAGGSPMLFAVGDGNHSLAAAKLCWEEIRENLPEEERASHPARFALCELVNLHDDSLEFEAIHRALFGCNPEKVLAAIKVYFPGSYEGRGDGQRFSFVTCAGETVITIPDASSGTAVGKVQAFLDDYVSAMGGRIDYIHGDDVVRQLCADENTCCFILPSMNKNELFPAVMSGGALPRKTFSMGEACDKRFYLECRRLVK